MATVTCSEMTYYFSFETIVTSLLILREKYVNDTTFSSSTFPSYAFGVQHFGWDFCVCDRLKKSNHWGSHFPSSWMVHAGCAFVADICPSRTWMIKSVRWNTCVHRLDLRLYSHPKEFWGNGVRTHINSMGKAFSTGKKISPEEDRTHNVSNRTQSPTHHQLSYAGPR